MTRPGQKRLTLDIQEDLHTALKRFSANTGLTVTDIISRYLRHLTKKTPQCKRLIQDVTITITDTDNRKRLPICDNTHEEQVDGKRLQN